MMLLEFIRYVIQEDIFRDNLKIMAQLADTAEAERFVNTSSNGEERFTKWADIMRHPEIDRRFMRDISRSKALHQNRIIKFMGVGYEGIAFKLDNGDVIKLGNLHLGVKADNGEIKYQTSIPQKYKKKMDKARSYSGTNHDIQLKDVGRAHAVMEELEPFVDWMYKLPSSDIEEIHKGFSNLNSAFFNAKQLGKDTTAVKKAVMKTSHEMTRQGMNSIIKNIALAFANEADNESYDLNISNLGVRNTSDGPVFVFYDF